MWLEVSCQLDAHKSHVWLEVSHQLDSHRWHLWPEAASLTATNGTCDQRLPAWQPPTARVARGWLPPWPSPSELFQMHAAWYISIYSWLVINITLQWRHNEGVGVSNLQPHDCLLNGLFRRRSKKTSNLSVTGLCAANSPVTGEFPTQRASNAENVSIWWLHLMTSSFTSLLQFSVCLQDSNTSPTMLVPVGASLLGPMPSRWPFCHQATNTSSTVPAMARIGHLSYREYDLCPQYIDRSSWGWQRGRYRNFRAEINTWTRSAFLKYIKHVI